MFFLVNELFKIEFVTYCPNKVSAVIQSAGNISDLSTCAANTNATGPGITTANPGSKATFTITSRDSQNVQRKRGGDVFVVKLKPEKGGNEIKVELNDRKNGTYLAEYTVEKLCGKLTLSVCLRGAHIKGSPFAVNVKIKSALRSYSPQYVPYPAQASFFSGMANQENNYGGF